MGSILVVREYDNFSRILAENGFALINCPTIQAVALEDLSDFEAKLGRLENYDGIFLTSATAALIFRKKLNQQKICFKGKVYVLGSRSFEILRTESLNLIFFESANTASEMLKMISFEDLSNKQFLFVGGERSLRIVPDYLTDFSGVDECIVYQTRKIAVEIDKLKEIREQLEKRKIITACFFSPSGAESFIEQFGADNLHQTKIAAIGTTTANFFEKQRFKVDFISSKATAENFAIDLVEYLGIRKRENE